MPSKWLRDHRQQDLRDHKKRIENMKSSIDTAPPREMPMSRRNEIERERKRALVEQDNRLLLDRLAIAMSHKNIDNVLVEKPFISLMELQRKKQLKRIMIQNSRLLERIQCTVPSYDHVQWEREAAHHVEILRNMTEFPDLFVAPGTHKKGYDMAIVDAERAQQKLLQNKGVERENSASPSKTRGNKGDSPDNGTKKGGAKTNSKLNASAMSNGDQSPNSQVSKNSAFVPYSYFPEEQYAQYQMQLQMQQQLQQQLHAQQMMQLPPSAYPGQLQQQQQQGTQYVQSQPLPYIPGIQGQGTHVPLAPALTPEQQYAHQQQLFLYHQQQQQRANYPSNNFQQPQQSQQMNGAYANPNQPYYYDSNAPVNNTNNAPPQQLNNPNMPYYSQPPQYGYGQMNNNMPNQQGVQLPNIYEQPPGHVAQGPY
mmetsp:Transcript_53048/g.92559  ORF Transcript_53048/g.92559 Transcript_53048/m.92559 type:complete len:424 (-) Transcript_53048:113-1384(-)